MIEADNLESKMAKSEAKDEIEFDNFKSRSDISLDNFVSKSAKALVNFVSKAAKSEVKTETASVNFVSKASRDENTSWKVDNVWALKLAEVVSKLESLESKEFVYLFNPSKILSKSWTTACAYW